MVAGCSSVEPPNGAAPGDLATVGGDLADPTPPDLATPSDLAEPDLASPDLLQPYQGGLTWPATQTFPSFGPVGALDVIDVSGIAGDQQALVLTLQGLVNRWQPRIYVQNNDGEGKSFWLAKLGVTTTVVATPLALVAKYQSEVKGIVIYDDTLADTINLATVIAGQKGGVVASPSLATTLTAAPYSLPVLADLRTNHFASKLAVYQYELANYSTLASHRLIIGLNPAITGSLRDYAVATQAMVVWLDPRVAAEQSLLSSFLALLPPTSPYLGWWVDEPSGVHAASAAGVPTFAADWSMNLTVLGGTPRGSAVVPAAPAPPPLENKVYVAIFMSDGDNVQEDQHLVPLKWNDAHRGQVPIGWTIDPALVDVAPVILRYFQSTATPDDVLVSGPSGLGYTYPAAWPGSTFDTYAQVSGQYMSAAHLDVITVWNNGVDLSSANAHSYAAHMPELRGLTIQDESQALQFIDGWLPLIRLAISYGDDAATLEGGIDAQLSGWNGAAPLFVAVQGNMNSGNATPSAFYDVQQHYASNSNVVFVRPDHFFQLARAAHQPAQHQLFSGDFDGNGKSDSLFYYAGDGNWWMGLSDGTNLTWHLAGNTNSLGSLIDGQHAFYTGDFNGDGKSDVLIYGGADGSWRLGTSDGTNLTWQVISTVPGYGNLLDGRHRTLIGDFNGDGKSDVLFYYGGDGHVWLGLSSGSALTWHQASDTSGYGNLLDGSHAIFTGDFDGNGKRDLGFYYNGDGNFWVGLSDGANLTWSKWSTTLGYGNLIDSGHQLLSGDFDGNGKSDFLFFYNGDGHWWMGLSDGKSFTWHQAGTVATNLLDWSHRLYTGDFDGNGKSDAAYYSDDGSWWVGLSDGTNLSWQSMGNVMSQGNLLDPSRMVFGGDYDGDGKSDIAGYNSNDGNWNVGLSSGTSFTWHVASNTSGFGDLTH
jgi:hypothetical protein